MTEAAEQQGSVRSTKCKVRSTREPRSVLQPAGTGGEVRRRAVAADKRAVCGVPVSQH